MKILLFAVFPALCLITCARPKPPEPALPAEIPSVSIEEDLPDLAETLARLTERISDSAEFSGRLSAALGSSELPGEMIRRITDSLSASPAFILDFLSCLEPPLEEDPYLWRLVDKQHPLPDGYAPGDLVALGEGSYKINRPGLMLRKAAAGSLGEMAAAAKAEGVTLVVSSAYRSYNYQVEVYNRIVKEMGQEAADRESARPGFSQHQTGLAVDFGSIDDSFAETAAGRWIAANASRFGWSISFPRDYEAVTGYRWESWHYRYVGPQLADFINDYFNGIQQYALRFIHEWEKSIVQ
jgi:D-alanyl-D-alanine carboxypeptidase